MSPEHKGASSGNLCFKTVCKSRRGDASATRTVKGKEEVWKFHKISASHLLRGAELSTPGEPRVVPGSGDDETQGSGGSGPTPAPRTEPSGRHFFLPFLLTWDCHLALCSESRLSDDGGSVIASVVM